MFNMDKKLSYTDLTAALESGSDLNSMNFAGLTLSGVDFREKADRLLVCSCLFYELLFYRHAYPDVFF